MRLSRSLGRSAQPMRPAVICITIAYLLVIAGGRPLDQEYTGKFEPQLVVNRDDLEQVVFKPMRELGRIQIAKQPESDATVTTGRLYHSLSDKSAILALLVEPPGGEPYLLADVDMSGTLDEKERFSFSREEADNPYIWQTTLNEPLKDGFFPMCQRDR